MNRDARTMILDIKARLAAARIAERRIIELIDQKGHSFFLGALRKILTVTAEAAKKKVGALHDGIFRQPRFMDTVGPEPGLTRGAQYNSDQKGREDQVELRRYHAAAA